MTDDELDRVIETLNQHKGELIAVNCLLVSLLRALPLDRQVVALRELDAECKIARTVLLNSPAPEAVLKSFEIHVGALNALRSHAPDSDDSRIA